MIVSRATCLAALILAACALPASAGCTTKNCTEAIRRPPTPRETATLQCWGKARELAGQVRELRLKVLELEEKLAEARKE